MEARAYTEQDVRNNPELCREIAEQYVYEYTGSFEILVSYQERLRAGSPLTLPMIKATLNCMRYDASVQIMPPVEPTTSNVLLFVQRKTVLTPKHKEEVLRPRPVRIVALTTKWNKTFGVSTGLRASAIHRVDLRSHFEYDTELKTYRCRMWWQCSTAWGMSRVPPRLLSDEEAVEILRLHGQWNLCKRCEFLASKNN